MLGLNKRRKVSLLFPQVIGGFVTGHSSEVAFQILNNDGDVDDGNNNNNVFLKCQTLCFTCMISFNPHVAL